MNTIEYIFGSEAMFRPALIASIAIALQAAILSVFVVVKRLAFVGQGVSHAAFGGVGLAVVLGVAGLTVGGTFGYLAVVGVFCVLSAWGIALLSANRGSHEDSAIGIVLVGAMAMGALMLNYAARSGQRSAIPSLDSVLFGDILAVGRADAWLCVTVAFGLGSIFFFTRRPLLLWTHDEVAAASVGVRTGLLRYLLLTLLAVFIVVSMRLAGVVLATAMLVLPGAIALRLSERLRPVFVISLVSALVGVVGGLVISFEWDLPPGACMVLTLIALFAASWPTRWLTRRLL